MTVPGDLSPRPFAHTVFNQTLLGSTAGTAESETFH